MFTNKSQFWFAHPHMSQWINPNTRNFWWRPFASIGTIFAGKFENNFYILFSDSGRRKSLIWESVLTRHSILIQKQVDQFSGHLETWIGKNLGISSVDPNSKDYSLTKGYWNCISCKWLGRFLVHFYYPFTVDQKLSAHQFGYSLQIQ